MASQRWDKGGSMMIQVHLMFRALAKLFGFDGKASKLYRGSMEIDRRAAEVRRVVTMIMDFVNQPPSSDLARPISISGEVHDGFCIYGGPGRLTLYYSDTYGDDSFEIYDPDRGGFIQPPLKDLVYTYWHLDHIVDGILKLEKSGRLEEYLRPYLWAGRMLSRR